MNYYKHHIGDYAKKTVHLSLLEHGAYLMMLHAYYGTEKPLPVDALYRITRAHTKAERAAVDSVAAQFWNKTEHGFVNGRAFEELEIATVQVSAARENGKRGGRPKITQRVPENNPVGFENVTQRVLKNKAIHNPDSDSDPSDLPKPAPILDPRKRIFDIGVSMLGESGRSVIGRAIRDIGEERVGEILGAMAIKPPAEPKAYFIAATQQGHRGVVV